jgi:hypothetical protein
VYLKHHKVNTVVARNITGSDKEAKARDRFTFFEDVCQKDRYDLCLHTDFRDSMFQADPFLEFYSHDANDESDTSTSTTTTTTTSSMFDDQHEHLYIYQHAKIMNPWHFRKLAACGLYDRYSQHVAGKWIVNSGSIIATPLV